MELRRLKWEKLAKWAVGVIRKYYLGWQVRKAVREMRRREREREAVVVIQKYCRGWQVGCDVCVCVCICVCVCVCVLCR